MKRNLVIFFETIVILGLLTLGFALFLSHVAPNLMYTYMTQANSFSYDYMYPDATMFYILSGVEIVVGIIGICKFAVGDNK